MFLRRGRRAPRARRVPRARRRLCAALLILSTAPLLSSCTLRVTIGPPSKPSAHRGITAPTSTARSTPLPAATTPLLATATATTLPIIVATAPAAVGTWGTVLAPLSGGAVYRDPAEHFSLRVPSDWRRVATAGAEVSFLAPGGTTRMGVLRKSLARTPSMTLDGYSTLAVRQIQHAFPNALSVGVSPVMIATHRAYRRIYLATVGGLRVYVIHVSFIDRATVHTIVFTTSPRDYGELAPLFDAIAGSYMVGAT